MQADATMAASNRPMFCLSAMSATLRKVRLLLQCAVPMQSICLAVLCTCSPCA